MLPTPHPVEFLVTAFVLIAVPGPSVVFVVGRGVALGRRAALATVAGNASGFALQLLLVSIGVGSLVASSDTAVDVLQLAGAGFIVYLGLRNVWTRREIAAGVHSSEGSDATRARFFREGLTVGATNPKGVLMFTAVLPQFLASGEQQVTLEIAALGSVCILMSLFSDGAWALASGTARRWLGTSARRLERLTAIGGVLLVAVGISLAIVDHGVS